MWDGRTQEQKSTRSIFKKNHRCPWSIGCHHGRLRCGEINLKDWKKEQAHSGNTPQQSFNAQRKYVYCRWLLQRERNITHIIGVGRFRWRYSAWVLTEGFGWVPLLPIWRSNHDDPSPPVSTWFSPNPSKLADWKPEADGRMRTSSPFFGYRFWLLRFVPLQKCCSTGLAFQLKSELYRLFPIGYKMFWLPSQKKEYQIVLQADSGGRISSTQ